MDIARLTEVTVQNLEYAVKLAQKMVQTPSLSGQEKELAELTRQTMEQLRFDEVYIDEVGNVIGRIKGRGGGRSVMFNCHLDTVAAGDPAAWKYPPFAGVIADGALWGLGASDTKAAFACQIVAAAALKEAGMLPTGDIWVVGVVHEETSGFGSRYLAKKLAPDVVILGEASDNQIKIGHRGRMQFDIYFKGKPTHASVPARGVNPHFAAARLLLQIERLKMQADPFFGESSVAPTLYVTDQTSSNVTPGQVVLSLDWRNIPGETEENIRRRLEQVVAECLIPGVTARIELKMRDVGCYTGYKGVAPAGEPSFATPPDDPIVLAAQQALAAVFNRKVSIGVCGFATDGGHFRAEGSKVIIFAPSEERYCHTTEDSVSIEKMREAILGNMALALCLGAENC